MVQLIEAIAAELERSREITAQVAKHIDGAYGIERDAIGPFLQDKLPNLDDDEHDLILSPLFTPKLADQSVFAELLDKTSVPREDWPELIHALVNRPIRARLIAGDGQTHTVVLRTVSIERFVLRLRLDGTIADSTLASIERAPAADRPMLKAIARRGVWENAARRDILDRFLTRTLASGEYVLFDAVELLKLAENYQPADSAALLARIPRWVRTLEEEVNAGDNPKPFFSATVQQMHGGNDQRQRDEARAAAKRSELAFLKRLQLVLA